MDEPIVSNIEISNPKLSDEPSYEFSYVTFNFDKDVIAYSVKCMGTNHETGKSVQEGNKYVNTQSSYSVLEASNLNVREFASFVANSLISAEIHYTELYQEGENRINIYGLSIDKTWTSYQENEVYQPPPNAIIQTIGFNGKTREDGDNSRLIHQLNSSSNQLTPSEYGTSLLGQATNTGYLGISTKDDNKFLELNTSTSLARINYMFSFQVIEPELIKRLTFQITGTFNEPFRMEYWNVQTQQWDINTRVNFDGYGENVLLENIITNIAPYNDNGVFRISVFSITSGRLSHDFAQLVIEK